MIAPSILSLISAYNKCVEPENVNKMIEDSLTQIFFSICDILACMGYYSISRTSYNELFELSMLDSEFGDNGGNENKMLAFVLRLTSVNIYSEGLDGYSLTCFDPEQIFDVLYKHRDFELNSIIVDEDSKFVYQRSKMLSAFIDNKIICKLS